MVKKGFMLDDHHNPRFLLAVTWLKSRQVTLGFFKDDISGSSMPRKDMAFQSLSTFRPSVMTLGAMQFVKFFSVV